MPVLPCFGSVCLIETPGKLLWIAQFWSSSCRTKKLQRNRFFMNVYIFAPATVTWRFPGPFAHCFCTMLLAGISDIIQYLSLLHVFFNISSFQRSAYFTIMAYIAAFIACWPLSHLTGCPYIKMWISWNSLQILLDQSPDMYVVELATGFP